MNRWLAYLFIFWEASAFIQETTESGRHSIMVRPFSTVYLDEEVGQKSLSNTTFWGRRLEVNPKRPMEEL